MKILLPELIGKYYSKTWLIPYELKVIGNYIPHLRDGEVATEGNLPQSITTDSPSDVVLPSVDINLVNDRSTLSIEILVPFPPLDHEKREKRIYLVLAEPIRNMKLLLSLQLRSFLDQSSLTMQLSLIIYIAVHPCVPPFHQILDSMVVAKYFNFRGN